MPNLDPNNYTRYQEEKNKHNENKLDKKFNSLPIKTTIISASVILLIYLFLLFFIN
ncbi:hypothetical protein KQI36_13915 [Clostridium senegalense]|uniref:hypothetical protein n=1 Tax=Clostridium senegalense TaxID=1465809 RepID=UPI001C126C83|nr:hypothetical protein [Clostridium senegalense]MBU5227730.1 hypothetical protein [Clostridium senegalense]